MDDKKSRGLDGKIAGKKITRRAALQTAGVLAVGGVATMGFPAIVRSAQVKRYLRPLVAGLNAKEGDPTYISVSLIPQILREKYDVQLEMQIHPSSTLGTDLGQLELVQTGFIDITSHSQGQWGRFTDAWQFTDLPYSIKDWDHALRFLASDLFWQRAAIMEQSVNVKVLPSVGAGGFRMLVNNKHLVKGPELVKGFKIRTTGSPVEDAMWKAYGVDSVPIAFSETYTALAQGVADGFHAQPIWTFLFKFYEILDFATTIDAVFGYQIQALNRATFESMPEEIQKAFMLAAQDAADIANQKDRELEVGFQKKLQDSGMELYRPSKAEMKEWTAIGKSIWGSSGVDPAPVKALSSLLTS